MRVSKGNLVPRRFTAVLVLIFMSIGGLDSALIAHGQAPTQPAATQYQGYGFSALGVNDRITLGLLMRSTGNDLSVKGMDRFVQSGVLAFNVRRVLLDVGWQNYSAGAQPYQTWVDNWLTACDSLGVQNVLFVSQLTKLGVESPWVESVIKADPSAQTYFSNGTRAHYVAPDNPDVVKYLEGDLSTLYSFYGKHSSWVGIGTGSSSQDPYYGPASTMPELGYSNSTMASFANSPYYASDLGPGGRDPNGLLDSLWAEFRNFNSSILVSSGDWQTSVPIFVYGTSSNGQSLSLRFYMPENRSQVKILWYGNRQGASPGDLIFQVLNDTHGAPAVSRVAPSVVEAAGSITQYPGWQGPLNFRGSFVKGDYYWLSLSSPSTNSSNFYQVFVRNYQVDKFDAMAVGKDTGGRLSRVGQSILWIKGADNSTLALYPYQQPLVVPSTRQTFVASSSFAFNTIYLFLSDRHFNKVNGTLTVDDTSVNKVVATAQLSQATTRGLQNWIPIALNNTVLTQKDHAYSLTITEPNSGYSWIVALRGLSVSPAAGGFQGQSQFWLFRLAMADWGSGHVDFTSDVSDGVDAVTLGHPDAVSFRVPDSTAARHATFSGFSIFVLDFNSTGSCHPSACALTASLRGNNDSAGIPLVASLQSVKVQGSSIPRGGWLNVTGLNLDLAPGNTYWVVFSTDFPSLRFPMARLVSPYNLRVLVSTDGGKSWGNPAEGPTEFAFVARFSDGTKVGNEIGDIPLVYVDAANLFAQPFISPNSSQVTGVFVGPIKNSQDPNASIVVSLNPSDTSGLPSGQVLAEGRLFSKNITLDYGLQFVQFTSAARLVSGQKYWIVVLGEGPGFRVEPVVYTSPQPGVLSALISNDTGHHWMPFGTMTTVLSYRIQRATVPLPNYSTAQLFGALENFHNVDPNLNPSAGWNSYILSLEIQREVDLTAWLRGLSRLPFNFYGTGASGILADLRPRNYQSLAYDAAIGTCQDLRAFLVSNLPPDPEQFLPAGTLKLLKQCQVISPGNWLDELNYMKYLGPQYGLNTSASILVLDSTPSSAMIDSLLVSYNATYVDPVTNPEAATNSLARTRVVLVNSTASIGPEVYSSLGSFLRNGGTLVIYGPPTRWFGNLLGNNTKVIQSPTPGSQTASFFKRELSLWTKNTEYYQKLNSTVMGTSLAADGPGFRMTLTRLGLGQSVVLEKAGHSSWVQVSDLTVMISSMIESSLSPGSSSPFWYKSPGAATSADLKFSLKGTSNGAVLLWASNSGTGPEGVSISLNRTYFNLPLDWKVVNLGNLSVTVGQGDNVTLLVRVQPLSWAPFYIFANDASSRGDYSTLVVHSDYRYPNQALLTTQGPVNQSALLILTLSNKTERITIGAQHSLLRVSSASVLLSGRQGWFFSEATNTLFVKWESSSSLSTLRVDYIPSEATPPAASLPVTRIVWLLVGVLIAEFGILAYLRLSRKKSDYTNPEQVKVTE